MRFRRAEAQGQPAGAEPDCPRLEACRGSLAACPGVPRMPPELKPNGRRFLTWLEAWPHSGSFGAWFGPAGPPRSPHAARGAVTLIGNLPSEEPWSQRADRHHGSLPDDVKHRNLDPYWDQGFPSSEIATAVRTGLSGLKLDPDAVLNRGPADLMTRLQHPRFSPSVPSRAADAHAATTWA